MVQPLALLLDGLVGQQKVRLIEDEQNRATRKLAEQRLTELRYETLHNPLPESPVQTVASVLEAYQESVRMRLSLTLHNPLLVRRQAVPHPTHDPPPCEYLTAFLADGCNLSETPMAKEISLRTAGGGYSTKTNSLTLNSTRQRFLKPCFSILPLSQVLAFVAARSKM